MGFMKDYIAIYGELTGFRVRWRGTFGFACPELGLRDSYIIDKSLATDDIWKYRDPDGFVRALRIKMTWLHDPTLAELVKMGIGDFNELVEYEGEPAEFDTGTESWHELSYPEGDIGEYGEEAIEKINEGIAPRLTPDPVDLFDDDDEEDEMPEESWDELWQDIHRCWQEEEEKERESLPGSFGELILAILNGF